MKIWSGHGSEHSENLVLVGHFVDETAAELAAEKMRRLQEFATSEIQEPSWGEAGDARFTPELWQVLKELGLHSLHRGDLDEFLFEFHAEVSGKELTVTTDEIEVQAFLKLMIEHGARIELYSGHHWDDEGKPKQVG